MCGIYGILSLVPGASPAASQLAPMASATLHRGPDDEGIYVGQGIAMGMRRLSIIDLAHGHQPIANETDSVHVVCNGEIYNFREVREGLRRRGHRFKTGSDTEVILHLYEEHGPDLVHHLEGMFAFALWDSERDRLMLARDRLGIKPLYFRRDASRLIFASEAKAILALPDASAAINPAALEEYLMLGYTPSDISLFAGIDKLPPASVMLCEKGTVDTSVYWAPPAEVDDTPGDRAWAEQVFSQLEAAVKSEMVSDVPLGAFLSGGVDSSAVVATMARHSDRPVKTYAIGFDSGRAGAYYNELPYARQVASMFGTEHKEILVRPNVVELLPKLIWHLDEPVADSAFITTYLVSKFAREDVTVILSGVGGDELFGGYRRYLGEHYLGRYRRLPGWLRRGLVRPLSSLLPADRHSPLLNASRYARAFLRSSESPFEERYRSYVQVFGRDSLDRLLLASRRGDVDSLDKAFEVATEGDGLSRLMRVDLATQMPNDLLMLTDRMSMAASLECRVPLLNHKLVELGARIPARSRIRGGRLKNILKLALSDILPAGVLDRKKRGFGAPMGAWLNDELSPLLRRLVSREAIEKRGLLDWETVSETMMLHEARKEDHTDHLLCLLHLEIWARLYLDGQAPDDLTRELGGLVYA